MSTNSFEPFWRHLSIHINGPTCQEMRREQLKGPDIKRATDCEEINLSNRSNFMVWTERLLGKATIYLSHDKNITK